MCLISLPARKRRRWLAFGVRAARLLLRPPVATASLIQQSYDQAAPGYDDAWTTHMRDLTRAMLTRLDPPLGADGLDLACGTGFTTSALAETTGGRTVGVDASSGMLAVARAKWGGRCTFEHADILPYLRAQPDASADVITCAWALGYSYPLAVLREAARVLRPGGRLGIIDNTLFSLADVVWTAVLAFAERPEALQHAVRPRFLANSRTLAWRMRAEGLAVVARWDGQRTYYVPDGRSAIDRLRATGAAAGFEFAATATCEEALYARFAELLEARHPLRQIPITHRYLAAIGAKR